MVTGSEHGFVNMTEVAIDCFLNQTYQDKELLIINHGAKSFSGKGIREIKIRKTKDLHVGAMRNMAFEHALGDWLMTWDDDDWCAPNRMEYQSKILSINTMVLLKNRIHIDLNSERQGVYQDGRGCRNSMLIPTDTKSRFPNIEKGSCAVFRASFPRKKILDNPPELYVLNVHGKNLVAREGAVKNIPALNDSQKQLASMVRGLYKR